MEFCGSAELGFLEAVSRLVYVNPFLPERIEAERDALQGDFVPLQDVWSVRPDTPEDTPNNVLLAARTSAMCERLFERLSRGAVPSALELELYSDLVTYALYYRYEIQFRDLVSGAAGGGRPGAVFYRDFRADLRRLLAMPGKGCLISDRDIAHLFACLYQVRRAFHNIFRCIIGGSMASARLRASVWQSVFTHDIRRYRRLLYDRMGRFSVLVTGASGTGKELVARAIGLSRYIPFDASSCAFALDPESQFMPLNVSALSRSLLESELFGHRKGAFTGAVDDHTGYLESCGVNGTVFLDEIGEVEPEIQVKLLRVIETGVFHRLGETVSRRFEGKLIAATNRDLAAEMAAGRFRQDLFYRLCSDIIHTPCLREQVNGAPDELKRLVGYLSLRLIGEEDAPALVADVMAWIEGELGLHYAWPGNVRELDQCVRNVLVRKRYTPPAKACSADDAKVAAILANSATAEELLSWYFTRVYAEVGNYQETARRLGVDHRTVKSRIDTELLEFLTGAQPQ